MNLHINSFGFQQEDPIIIDGKEEADFCLMKIRDSFTNDHAQLSRLYQKLYPEQVRADQIPPFNVAEQKSQIFVAKENGSIVGIIWINMVFFWNSRYGYIEDLYVEEIFRHKGVASLLLAKSKECFEANKVQAVFVTTKRDNDAAMNLYKKQEFRECPGPCFFWVLTSGKR